MTKAGQLLRYFKWDSAAVQSEMSKSPEATLIAAGITSKHELMPEFDGTSVPAVLCYLAVHIQTFVSRISCSLLLLWLS